MQLQIRKLREKKGLTQRQLAEAVNLSFETIRSYEMGRITPSLQAAYAVAKALDVSVTDLIEDDEPVGV